MGYSTGPYMKMGDGLVKNEDLIWIGQQLGKAKEDGKAIISMAHYPLDRSLSNYKPLVAMLKDYEVPVSFCGHGHKLQQFRFRWHSGRDGTCPDGQATRHRLQSSYFSQRFENFCMREAFGWSIGANIGFPFETKLCACSHSRERKDGGCPFEASFFRQDSCSVMGGAIMVGDRVVFANSCGVVKCHHAVSGDFLLWQYNSGEAVYATCHQWPSGVCGNHSSGLVGLGCAHRRP